MCVFMFWVLNQVCLLFWLRLLHCKAANPTGRNVGQVFLVEEPLANVDGRTAVGNLCTTGQSACPAAGVRGTAVLVEVEYVGGVPVSVNVHMVAILTRNSKDARCQARLRDHGSSDGITEREGVHQAG